MALKKTVKATGASQGNGAAVVQAFPDRGEVLHVDGSAQVHWW
jgi:NAD(P)-dependent dehydrogenase (short-subunit alcohol dehydrogenase family)